MLYYRPSLHIMNRLLINLCLIILPSCLSLDPPILATSSQPILTQKELKISSNSPFVINFGKKSLTIPQQQQNGPILLTFFIPNCEPCGRLVRLLNQIQSQFSEQELTLLGACIAPSGCIQLKDFIATYKPLYPNGQSELPYATRTQTKQGPFGTIVAVPTTYLLDSTGSLIESFHGSLPLQYVIKLIEDAQ